MKTRTTFACVLQSVPQERIRPKHVTKSRGLDCPVNKKIFQDQHKLYTMRSCQWMVYALPSRFGSGERMVMWTNSSAHECMNQIIIIHVESPCAVQVTPSRELALSSNSCRAFFVFCVTQKARSISTLTASASASASDPPGRLSHSRSRLSALCSLDSALSGL